MASTINHCRLCQSPKLDFILDLGEQSFTGIFPKTATQTVPTGPLSLVKCGNCDLVQLAHSFDLGQMYGMTYGYRSGLNQSMVKHLREKVEKLCQKYTPQKGDLIIDIGSNDSTLLQSYPRIGLQLVGIDPSGVKFRQYYPDDISLIPDFFSAKIAQSHLGAKKAKLITSIAMFYDLEDPSQFVREVAEMLAEDGVWTLEQSYLPTMLDALSYDTICHEHLEYYALKQIKWMMDNAGLKIVDLEFNDVNGGSFSISVARKEASYPECTSLIAKVLEDEERRGLSTLVPYLEFKRKMEEHRDQIIEFFQSAKEQGKTIYGYGASTKGNVLLQYCGVTTNEMPCIAEVNEDKFGSFTPGTLIPIVSETEARKNKPDYFFVLPWHFRAGILKRETAFLQAGGEFVFPLPRFEKVSSKGSDFPVHAPKPIETPRERTSPQPSL